MPSQNEPQFIAEIKHTRLLTDLNILALGERSFYLRYKLVRVLEVLIRNQNSITLREELRDKIWLGNKFTYQQGTTQAICQLRKILTKFVGKGMQIKTVPKKGYCLMVDERQVYIDIAKFERVKLN